MHKQVHKRAEGAFPVHAFMIVKALVFNCNKRMLEIIRHLFKVHPDPVFRTVQASHLIVLSCLGVFGIDDACIIQFQIAQIQVLIGIDEF